MYLEIIKNESISIPAIKRWQKLRNNINFSKMSVDDIIAEYERLEKQIAKKSPLNPSQAFELLSIANILWIEDISNRPDCDCTFQKHRHDTILKLTLTTLRYLYNEANSPK